MEYICPVVLIYVSQGQLQGLSEIGAGLEEEGVPFKIVNCQEQTPEKLSAMAAAQSSMEAGIGLCSQGACFCSTTGGQDIFLIREAADSIKSLRALGSNAGRFVKKSSLRIK